jgi:hypothetical protein
LLRSWLVGVLPLVAVAAIALTGCGSDESTLSEYAEEVEGLVLTMNSGLDDLEALPDEYSLSLDDVRTYATERVALRFEFLEAFRALEPPDRVEEFHRAALNVMERLTAAEAALAEEARAVDNPVAATRLWETDAGVAAQQADEEAIALCKAAQAEFDATEENAVAAGVPWIPGEMKEVVRVALYCDRSERP